LIVGDYSGVGVGGKGFAVGRVEPGVKCFRLEGEVRGKYGAIACFAVRYIEVHRLLTHLRSIPIQRPAL
jgi:hypothetical protein